MSGRRIPQGARYIFVAAVRNNSRCRESTQRTAAARGRGPFMTSVIAEMEACIPALRRYASALLRDRQEVDDLVHDCLVRALDRLHTHREDAELRPWLFAIMHNLFVSRIRRIKRRGVMQPIDDADLAALGQRANQEDPLRRQDLMRALDELPE